ncbi:MAG: hypothetical protein HQM10_10765 [Candidatus Riflebacteria bacterium]|nr:hypothetical protein [Candidatus Riflebacteria bacterium]
MKIFKDLFTRFFYSVKPVFWIAYYSFLEALRNRLLLGIFCLIIPLIAGAKVLDVYQFGQVKMIKDLGLFATSIFGLLIVFILSFEQIIPDIEKKSVYFILSRMGSRNSYILGRYLGIIATLTFYNTIMTVFLIVLLKFYSSYWFLELISAMAIYLLKQSLLTSMIVLFATFTSRIVVTSLGIFFYAIGHSYDFIRMFFESRENPTLMFLFEAVVFFFPDFSLFEPRLRVVHDIPIAPQAMLLVLLYSVFFSLFYLGVGGKILSRKDL